MCRQNLDQKNRVTTVHLLQCKTNFFIRLWFWGRNLRKLKNIHLGKPPLISKKPFFSFAYTCLHSPRLVYNRLDFSRDSSSDSSTLVYIRLVTRLNSPTIVYICLDFPRLLWWLVCVFKTDLLNYCTGKVLETYLWKSIFAHASIDFFTSPFFKVSPNFPFLKITVKHASAFPLKSTIEFNAE